MLRRVAVVLVLALAGLVGATVHAEPASALVTDPITTADDWQQVQNWLRAADPPPALSTVNANPGATSAWYRAKVALGRIPKFGSIGVLPVVTSATAVYTGWEIGHATGISDWAYGYWSGIGPQAPVPASGTVRAYYSGVGNIQGGSTCASSPTSYQCHSGFDGTTLMVPNVLYSINSGSTYLPRSSGHAEGCTGDDGGVDPCDNYTSFPLQVSGIYFQEPEASIYAALLAAPWGDPEVFVGPVNGNTNGRIYFGENPGAFNNRFNATTTRAYSTTADAGLKTNTSTSQPYGSPVDYGTATATAVEEILEDDPTLAADLDDALHPGTATPAGDEDGFLPQPRFGETAPQYRARLRAMGFLGTITISVLDVGDAWPEFGPSQLLQIDVTTTVTETYPLLDPWPENPYLPLPGTTTEIVLLQNPEDAPTPAPGDPGSPGNPNPGSGAPPGGGAPGGGPAIGPGDCSCPPPDFTPVTSIEYGDKFPFGVVSLAGSTLGTFLFASPSAPVFSFDFDWLGIEPDYVVDLDVLDDYMSLIRTILTWTMWVGAVWWFGTRWFGFKGTGDVGAAVDDAL